jgi:hypothetical protein
MVLLRCKARPHRVRPADLLKPGRDLGVIEVGVIAALEADELKRVGVAAFHPALHDAGRPAPQARRPAMAELTSRRKCRKTLVVITRRRATAIARAAQPGKGTRTVSRPHAGDVVGVSRAHPSYPQAGSSDHLPGSGAARPAQSRSMIAFGQLRAWAAALLRGPGAGAAGRKSAGCPGGKA